MGLRLRFAEAGDEDVVVALWQACGLVAPYNDPAQDFRFARAKSNSDILLAVDDQLSIIGSLMVGHEGHRGWIYYVATHLDQHFKGVGRQLVEAAETWLRERAIVKVMLLVHETNKQVVNFYSRLDYETIPRLVMQKWLIKPKAD